MSFSHTFAKCPFCQCNSKGISIVLCGNANCRKIFCSVCGEIYLSPSDENGQKNPMDQRDIKQQAVAGCIHCWTVRPLIWNHSKGEPQIGKHEPNGRPIERQHIRMGEIQ